MKKFILAMCIPVAVVMLVTPVFAMELWDPHLRGANEGLAAGALPPPGVYFINSSYFAPRYHNTGNLPVPNVGPASVSQSGHANSDIVPERPRR